MLRLAMAIALLIAACAPRPAPPPPRPSEALLTGAVALETLGYRPRGGVPPSGFERDVPAYVGAALATALRRAGADLGGTRCVLDGTIRDFKVEASGGEEHYVVDIRYVLAVAGRVDFDQAIGTTHSVASGTPIDNAVAAAIAKNFAILVKDDWFRTLLRQECRARA